ncbi:hypothetical protein CPJCM30710_23390 [Clostridium polyendosporum]|uniref:ATP synthase I chain n=1 Tax=Clostridium polyendosporum TaxID=69208 RepID=A0A919VMK2_9CLOT|nr:ATP synthase subunit I [Clostridium polyendosporum]GIM29673.1 hypothetical protein CPJCM30710_23390 [Clostridium polyendosporum]
MERVVSKLIFNVSKINIILGTIITVILTFFFDTKIGSAFFLGTIISSASFIANGYVTSSVLKSHNKSIVKVYLSYFIRLSVIVLCGSILINDIKSLLAYIVAFVVHFIGFTINGFINQRGSD